MVQAGETGPTNTISLNGRKYRVDMEISLRDPGHWDRNFARAMAASVGMAGELSDRHWDVILFIRRFLEETGACPTLFQTCQCLGISLPGFKFLFPGGYQRGACKLAGVSHRSQGLGGDPQPAFGFEQSYRIDGWGFLMDPEEWDSRFALMKAGEMKVPGGLSGKHWEVIRFLREEFFRAGKIPSIYETCENSGLGVEEFGELFPDGFHRGAVKMAGLREP